MSFAPLDTGLLVQRLREQVPQLASVGGAADYAAVQELRNFVAPSAFVVFAQERNTGKLPTGSGACMQECEATVGVVLALRHYQELLGEQLHEEARELVAQVRAALIGFKPAQPGARALAWQEGRVLDYDAGKLLWADLYRVSYVMARDGA